VRADVGRPLRASSVWKPIDVDGRGAQTGPPASPEAAASCLPTAISCVWVRSYVRTCARCMHTTIQKRACVRVAGSSWRDIPAAICRGSRALPRASAAAALVVSRAAATAYGPCWARTLRPQPTRRGVEPASCCPEAPAVGHAHRHPWRRMCDRHWKWASSNCVPHWPWHGGWFPLALRPQTG
jgi:hypothetical protein